MDHTRQLDIIDPKNITDTITVIGLGGIGSFVIPILAKMGCPSLAGFEFDEVEDHNIPVQNFRIEDVGKSKGKALQEIVAMFSDTSFTFNHEKFEGQVPLEGIVISAVDKMSERRVIWESIELNPAVRLYIDARMGGQVAHLFSINPCSPDDIGMYKEKLFSDEEAEELACTARTVIYTVNFIAGLIANQIKKFVNGEELHRQIIWDAQTLSLIPIL